MVPIWATCKIYKFKSPSYKSYGEKTKAGNCLSWSGCIKHVEHKHYLLDPKYLEEAHADLKDHGDSLEERKARKRTIKTWFQGKGKLDDCMEGFGHRGVETKRA